jgi:hypothetical protein
VGLALTIALALSTPVFAQTADNRLSLNAAFGPSFANLGTTFSTTAGLEFRLNDRTTLVGEFGALPHAPFRDAAEIAAPLSVSGSEASRVNAYHWNGNVKVQPFNVGGLEPYFTGGLGSFTADMLVNDTAIGPTTIEERRRVSDFATNLGAGVLYRFNDWVGVGADYRTFFVHRDDQTPRVNRFTAGLIFSIK